MPQRLIKCSSLAFAVALLAGCGGSSAQNASQKASDRLQKKIYQSTHNVEFRNYNLRQKVSDDPSTILWCTFFPPGVQGATNGSTPGQTFTVPIAGKLTSSAKRPYSGTYTSDNGTPGTEVPGPDHMFGSSAEYRYGFDPTLGIYYEFTGLSSFCTTEPTVWQSHTTIIADTSKTLASLTRAAEAALRAGDAKKAAQLLKQADNSGSQVKVGAR